MTLLIILAIIVVTILLLAVSALVVMAVKLLRKEVKEVIGDDHPCGTCVRWSECNGVDEECPKIRNKNFPNGDTHK